MLRIKTLVFLMGVCLPNAFGGATPNSEKARSRLEDLFLWKVSDTLNLSPDEENKFNLEFRNLSDKKLAAATEMEKITKELGAGADPKQLSKSLENYKSSLTRYNQVQIDELKSMRKIFGDKRFAQYLILKHDLTQKLKNLLSSPSRPESGLPKSEVRETKVE